MSDVVLACGRHPVLCADIGMDGLRFWREVQHSWQDKKWSPEAWQKLRTLIIKVIRLIIKDPEGMRDLLERLRMDAVWYPCLGMTEADVRSLDTFEPAIYRFLSNAAGIERSELDKMRREGKSKVEIEKYVDEKLAVLEKTLIDCREKDDQAACASLRSRMDPACPLVRWLPPTTKTK